MNKKAFTLIELLIVVAIIAILAAIAVPNFLEAQVRSKVSRVRADQRTLATAIESYTVDYNRPPSIVAINSPRGIGGSGAINGGSVFNPGQDGVSSRLVILTTPVSYIGSVFRDPFVASGTGLAETCNTPGQSLTGYDGYDYVSAWSLCDSAGPSSPLNLAGNRCAAVTSGANWHVVSVGPDFQNCFGGGTDAQAFGPGGDDYDPTNGTISSGDVVRIGSGPGELLDDSPQPAINRITNARNY